MIEAVIVFLHADADNKYIPFDSLDDTKTRIAEYVNAGFDPELLIVYVEASICSDRRDAFWNAIMPLGVPYLYELSPVILQRVTKS